MALLQASFCFFKSCFSQALSLLSALYQINDEQGISHERAYLRQRVGQPFGVEHVNFGKAQQCTYNAP